MASLFGARRRRSPEEDGADYRSGNGRSQRRRLPPEEDAASPAEAAGTSPGWLYSFVSGAKRVFSSVLLFSTAEEPASGDEEEEDDSEDGNGLSSSEQIPLPHSPLSLPRPPLTPCFSSVSRLSLLTVLA
jgi:hypothetical protein